MSTTSTYAGPQIVAVELGAANSAAHDALVLVTPTVAGLSASWAGDIERAQKVDGAVGKSCTLVIAPSAPGSRVIVAPTGPLDRDYDDVRRFGDAAREGVLRAKAAGATRPLLVVHAGEAAGHAEFRRAAEVAALAALQGLYEQPEAWRDAGEPVVTLGLARLAPPLPAPGDGAARAVAAIEAGRRLARDIAGPDCEAMAPPKVVEALRAAFAGSDVRLSSVHCPETLHREYPLLMAVARASLGIRRHAPAVVTLEWQGEGPVETTLYLCGKGVTYDTGGADVKHSGAMAGMSRDKGGAAVAAGFVKTVSLLRPRGVRVVASLGLVRNSVGPDAYVSDEVISGHSGCRVKVGNTDAEGRMVLADLLSHARVAAAADPAAAANARLFTLATLTGHVGRAYGPYPACVDNGPARAAGVGAALRAAGEAWGDPFELSTLRREDYAFVAAKIKGYDVLQANRDPSVNTARGHQYPVAFMNVASGLERHGRRAAVPLAYSHLDIAAGFVEGMDWQHGKPTAASLPALTAAFVLPRCGIEA